MESEFFDAVQSNVSHPAISPMAFKLLLIGLLSLVLPQAVSAQSLYYLYNGGRPSFLTPETVERGFVDVANGDLHLEIPLASPVQRGSLPAHYKLVYDSRIWTIVNNGTSKSWQPINLSSMGLFINGGWSSGYEDGINTGVFENIQYCNQTSYTTYYGPTLFMLTDGTVKFFPISTQKDSGCGNPNVASGDAFDQHSSGFHMYVTNYTTPKVYAKNGTILIDATQSVYGNKDSNGNYFTADSNGNLIDTLNRTPVAGSQSGNTITISVENSQGSTSTYTVTESAINVSTNFGVSGVTEYSGTITVITQIKLPDGTTYSFNYDSGTTAGHYGLLTSMTLPTGGTIDYTWANFSDAYGTVNRWLASRASGGGTWTYTPSVITTCSSNQVDCQQKVTETKPSGDETVYTFTLNNGAWNTETDYYNGSSTLLKKATTTYDFSNACPDCGGVGASYIRPTQVVTSMPSAGSTLESQTEYSYDSIYYGNVSAQKEWNYTTGSFGSTPDRETDYTYLASSPYVSANILNRVTDKVVYQSGTKVAETQTTYDSTGLSSVTGVTHHDDTNYGTSNTVRGNPTVISQWVSGSTYLTTTNDYDTTGQLTKTTDPAGNSITYSYTDDFYNDNGSNPPASYTPSAPTHAYRTKATMPVSGTLEYGYYFGTGKQAVSTDQNGQNTYQHYVDPLDRPTLTFYPHSGWKLAVYSSATQTDTYTSVRWENPSSGCTYCRHDETAVDGLGRVVTQELVSDPQGTTSVTTTYDSSGRVFTRSNPYRSTSDPTYGLETYSYDGLNRQTSDTHPDSNAVKTYYGANVTSGGGIGTPLCSTSTYGYGYPTLTVDEAGHKSETWTDAFGRTIEADEPDSTGALTLGTCYKYDALNDLTTVAQGSQTRTYAYDGLGRKTSETTPEAGATNYDYTTSTGGLCAGDPSRVCRRIDARSITTTYTYDAENRLTQKSYSDSTPTAYFYYDESSVTVGSANYTISNGKGRLTHTSSDNGNALTIHNYDPAGDPIDLWQCTPYNCASGNLWDMNYSFYPGGEEGSLTHPAGFTITEDYGTDARLNGMYSSLSYPQTIGTFTYAPQGALASFENGGGKQLTETYDYNNRLQVVRLQLAPYQTTNDLVCWVYNYYGNVGNPTACSIPSQGTGNDGDVVGQYEKDTANASLSHTVGLTYDPTHRLTSSVATGNATHNLTFSYDRYGNITTVRLLNFDFCLSCVDI